MYTAEDVHEWVGAQAYRRAQALAVSGARITEVEPLGAGEVAVHGRVKDTRRAPYVASFYLQDGMLYAECTCAREFDCAHGAAIALAHLAATAPALSAAAPPPAAVDAPPVLAPAPQPAPAAAPQVFPPPGASPDWRRALAPPTESTPPDGWSFAYQFDVSPTTTGPARLELRVRATRADRRGELVAVPWTQVTRGAYGGYGSTPEALLKFMFWQIVNARPKGAARNRAAPSDWLAIPAARLGEVLGLLALAPELRSATGRRAHVHPQDRLEGRFEMVRGEAGVVLTPLLARLGGPVDPARVQRLAGVRTDWGLVDGSHFHPLGAVPAAAPVAIPAAEVAAFERRYLPDLALTGRLTGPDAPSSAALVPGQPAGVLLLEDGEEPEVADVVDVVENELARLWRSVAPAASGPVLLRARVAYRYGDEQVRHDEPVAVVGPPTGPFMTRDRAQEQGLLQALSAAGLDVDPLGVARLGEAEALSFVAKRLPKLAAQGWTIVGEDVAKRYKLASGRAMTTLRVTSGIDWFDVQAEVAVGQEVVPWPSLLRALEEGRQYVQLGSGAYAQLPKAWLERQQAMLGALRARPSDLEGGLRVARHQAPLVAQLAEAADAQDLDAGFAAFTERLRTFGGIADVPAPAGFTGELRPYQARGLAYLAFLRDYGLHGILADDMGLGKTVQAAALLALAHAGGDGPPSLVVAPTSLLENWRSELARFAPGLRTLVLHGPARDFGAITGHDVVITTYATARLDADQHAASVYDTLLLDEAQAIKNPQSQTALALGRLQARHRLCLTGTPIENDLSELWSLFRFLMPGFLGQEKDFRRRYAQPIAAGNREARDELKARVAPFILRRLKADVAPELPPRTDVVHWCELLPAQRRAYDTVLAAGAARVEAAVAERGLGASQITILDALLKLRQVCCHPALLKTPETLSLGSGKLDAFLELVDELVAGGHRALVFSQFTQMLALLRAALDARQIPYAYLDGRTRDRAARVEAFNTGTDPLFLISLKAGGTGLNLTGADYVIHFDPWWNPAAEDQATDRAHRIGQTRHVFSYKLIAKGTIEEKLLALQDRKRELVRDLLDAEAGADGGKRLTKEDLAYLFEAPAGGAGEVAGGKRRPAARPRKG